MKSIVGKILYDRYRVIQELSQDDFSTAYAAEDLEQPGKPQCQIERLQPQYDSEVLGPQSWQKVLQAFVDQGNVLKNISQHPQIPQLLAFFECDREFYLVQEFINGESLAQKVEKSVIDEAEAIEWLQEILSILEFIHQSKIKHLNIQPTSLIENRSGQKFLTSFAGIKNSILFNSQSSKTVSNQDFSALEHQEGKPDCTSDIYALGKTIIYALTGSINTFIQPKLVKSEVPQLATADIRPELATLLNKMVANVPTKRYQSATEVLAKLDFERQNVVVLPPPFFNSQAQAIPTTSSNRKIVNSNSRPAASRSKFSQTIIWLLLTLPFIFALFMIFIGINKNTYKDFVDYVSNDYQFTLKYPPTWSYRELDDPITGGAVVFTSPLETNADLFLEKVYIAVEYLPSDNTTLEQYAEAVVERIEQKQGNDIEVYPEGKIKLAQAPARSVIYSRQESGLQLRQMETFTIKNNQVYIAIYTAERSKFSKFLTTAEKIINSWEINSTINNE